MIFLGIILEIDANPLRNQNSHSIGMVNLASVAKTFCNLEPKSPTFIFISTFLILSQIQFTIITHVIKYTDININQYPV